MGVIKETAAGTFRDAFSPVKAFQSRALVPGSMGECPLLDTQGNAGSAGWSPAGGKAGRTATCKHALGTKRHQAWSSKDVFIFPSGKSKMSNTAHRLPGRVSPPSLSSCPLGCPGWGWN